MSLFNDDSTPFRPDTGSDSNYHQVHTPHGCDEATSRPVEEENVEEVVMDPYRWLDRAILDADDRQSKEQLIQSIDMSRKALDELVLANPDVIIVRCAYSLPIFEGKRWQNDECMTRADYELLKQRDWEYAFPSSAFGKYSDVFAWLDDIVYNVIDDTRTALFMIITGRIKCHPFLHDQHVKFEEARTAQGEESASAVASAEAEKEQNSELDTTTSVTPTHHLPEDDDNRSGTLHVPAMSQDDTCAAANLLSYSV